MNKKLLILGSLMGLLMLTAMADAQAPVSADKAGQASDIVKKADALYARKLYEDAIAEYRKALNINPKDPVIQNKLGIAYHQSQNLGAARKAYEQAIKLNPKYAEAWNNLGTVYYSQKSYKKAIMQYKKAIEIRPTLATAYLNMGAALFARGQYEEGFKAYSEAYRLDPTILERTSMQGTVVKTAGGNQAMQNFYMARLYAANGDLEKALVYLQKAHEDGFKDFDKVEKDPVFKGLLNDERYIKLTRRKPAKL